MADDLAATRVVREQLLELIDGHGAHLPFDEAVKDFPPEAINRYASDVTYTPWHLLEHIRAGRTAQDLLYEILLKSGFPLTTPVASLTVPRSVTACGAAATFGCQFTEPDRTYIPACP